MLCSLSACTLNRDFSFACIFSFQSIPLGCRCWSCQKFSTFALSRFYVFCLACGAQSQRLHRTLIVKLSALETPLDKILFDFAAVTSTNTHTHTVTTEMQIFAMFYEGGVFILCAKATRLNDWNCVWLLCML